MQKFFLPHVILPTEFVSLLKSNISATTPSNTIVTELKKNQALYLSLEKGFKEFDDGRGFEKTMAALGWSNFRDRLSSIYVYKSIFGQFPLMTSMDLVEDIKVFENRYSGHSVHGLSRVFLLGFYLRLANLQIQQRESNKFLEIKVPDEVSNLLKLSQGRSEKIDWLILILMHLMSALGYKMVAGALANGRKFQEIYSLMSSEAKKQMMDSLLAYGASIFEQDTFVYDKV